MKEGYADATKAVGMKLMNLTLSSPLRYRMAGKMGRWFLKYAPFAVNNRLNLWYKNREMPEPPKQSFGEWYKKNISN